MKWSGGTAARRRGRLALTGRAVPALTAPLDVAMVRHHDERRLAIVERRDWCVGTPDDAIAWIEKKLADNGPFGGVMLSMHEWTRSEKLRRSLELFARYVMPRFRKPTTHFRDEWVRLQAAVSEHGAVQIETDERGSNLRSV